MKDKDREFFEVVCLICFAVLAVVVIYVALSQI